ncbi:hypothetical protein [Shewanella zhangzhouensis]|uniref:hypothetical protein n=1 Tax=Shewanella zhangzhouensis TaxID=2864213 RepID=UPI001C65EE06|nr:hypothetical protein [Shewanella zhangzhouensis]QYK04369.1 hypothetical protein K0H63_15015 [Shewanella zhangzhouensis]
MKYRFAQAIINELLALKIYDWPEEKFNHLKRHLCANDIEALKAASADYDSEQM